MIIRSMANTINLAFNVTQRAVKLVVLCQSKYFIKLFRPNEIISPVDTYRIDTNVPR